MKYSVAFLLAWHRTKREWCTKSLQPYSFYSRTFQNSETEGWLLIAEQVHGMMTGEYSQWNHASSFFVSSGWSPSLSLLGDGVSWIEQHHSPSYAMGSHEGSLWYLGRSLYHRMACPPEEQSVHTPLQKRKHFNSQNSKPPAGLTLITRFSLVFSSSSLSHGSLFTRIHYHDQYSQTAD